MFLHGRRAGNYLPPRRRYERTSSGMVPKTGIKEVERLYNTVEGWPWNSVKSGRIWRVKLLELTLRKDDIESESSLSHNRVWLRVKLNQAGDPSEEPQSLTSFSSLDLGHPQLDLLLSHPSSASSELSASSSALSDHLTLPLL